MKARSAEQLCDQADKAREKGNQDQAEKYFRQALARDPASKRALLGVASCLISQYDFEEARRLLNRCLYHFPGDPDALLAQARLEAEQGEHAKAVALFDQVISRDASSQKAQQGKIQSLLAQGKTADARQSIESIAPSGSRPPWLLVELGRVSIAERAYDAAVEAFLDAGESKSLYEALDEESDRVAKGQLADAIAARKPDDAQALTAVARAREASGDRGAAIEAWTKFVEVKPKDEGAYVELIRLLRLQERYDDAEAAYQTAVRSLGPPSERLLLSRARVFFAAGKRDEGIEALAQVPVSERLFRVFRGFSDQDAAAATELLAERQPKNTRLLTYAASRLAHAGDRPRALELLDRALAVDPRDTKTIVAKGKILLEADRLDDLDSLLKKAFLALGAKNSALLSLRAQLLIALERYDEAMRVAVSAGAEDDIQEHVDSLRATGELQKAEKLVNAAVAECPGSDLFLRAQGELLLEQRKYQAARQAFHAIWAKNPDDTNALLRGTFALRSARMFPEAQQIVDRALRRVSPENRPALLLEVGFLAYDQGKFEEAVAAYDAVLAVDADNGDAHLWKIRALCRSNRRKDAEKLIRQTLDRVPIGGEVRAQIMCEMGKMHEVREEWEAALKSYNEALDVDPTIAEVHFSKANVLLRLSRNEDAGAVVLAILEQRGSENDIREAAGWFYLKKKDFRRAETQFQEILKRSASSILAINGLGGIYFEQGKFDLAENKFREALKIDRNNAVLWNNVGWALVRQVRESDANREAILTEAENHCRKSLELSPDYAEAHACLGIIAFKRGKLLQCEELLKRSADLDPAGASYSDLGALYTHLGRYNDAEKALRKGHDRDPYDATVRVELGNVYLQMGRTKDAIAQLKEACAIDPEAARPIGALALALCKNGDLLEALRVLRDAIRRLDPSGVPALRVMLSRVLTELGDKTDDAELYDQALKEARLAIAAQPGDAEANFNAGIACFKQSNYPAAIKHFNRCCELDKNNFEAEQNLRKLKSLNRNEQTRTRIGTQVGNAVALICLILLISLWTIYLRQPLPATKETIRQIDSTMLLTMSPILLALIFVSLLMPWLTKLKLPGGVEAELTQPKEQISRGPSGPLTLNAGSSGFSSGH